MIRVVIADDHALVRQGLRRMLKAQKDVEIIAEAQNGAEAVQLVRDDPPDVLLLDISMPVKDGMEATAEIKALQTKTRILVLSMHGNEQYALRVLRAGASGFIGKEAPFEQLVTAIHTVHSGERYLPPEIEQAFAARYLRPDTEKTPIDLLSKREFQVMTFLAQGMTNREIAKMLNISVKTVDTHRGHLLKKLNLRNNSDVTRFAIQNGYVTM